MSVGRKEFGKHKSWSLSSSFVLTDDPRNNIKKAMCVYILSCLYINRRCSLVDPPPPWVVEVGGGVE